MIQINIVNDTTGDLDRGNYEYEVILPGRQIKGRVTDFKRSDGWVVLAVLIIEAASKQQGAEDFQRRLMELRSITE